MTNITKADVEGLLKLLGDDCKIGDVLEKMPKKGADKLKLVRLWEVFGESVSLQQIVEESGWYDEYIEPLNVDGTQNTKQYEKRLISPEARELISFILNLELK